MRAELGRASPFSSVVAANGHEISEEVGSRVGRRGGGHPVHGDAWRLVPQSYLRVLAVAYWCVGMEPEWGLTQRIAAKDSGPSLMNPMLKPSQSEARLCGRLGAYDVGRRYRRAGRAHTARSPPPRIRLWVTIEAEYLWRSRCSSSVSAPGRLTQADSSHDHSDDQGRPVLARPAGRSRRPASRRSGPRSTFL